MNRPPFFRQSGFAVVLVLIAIGLAATMAVLFLSSVASERRGVNLYSQQSQARHLADTAVNLVLNQINSATKEGISSSQWVSWASQPGMIRTYNTNGALSNAYKLYSWDNLVETGGMFNPGSAAEVPAADWASKPAFYCDLNQPVNNVYPILDPAAAGKVEGFQIDQNNPAVTAATTGSAPMPVKWLYILQDGSYVTPSGGSGTQATIPGASGTNPVVGRIAFWTDDETSKVNVNTASEGAYWDWPKGGSPDELQFAANPPVKGEFQRFPGHPATTCISPVFPELRTGGGNRWSTGGVNGTYQAALQNIYAMSPRNRWGGSQGGTYPVTSYTQSYTFALPAPAAPSAVVAGTDRLYATADDFWFQPGRDKNAGFGSAGLSPTDVARRLFFFTANSRAPETTLFETPRISMWPMTWPYHDASYWNKVTTGGGVAVFAGRAGTRPTTLDPASDWSTNPWMTPEEQLLAYCSTLNASGTPGTAPRYFFQRQQSENPTFDYDRIQRNKDLVNYLRKGLDQNVPGFGCSLASKWNGENSGNADWIALNCFDYSRSQINQYTVGSTGTSVVVPGVNELSYSYSGVGGRQIIINGTNRGNGLGLYLEPNAFTVMPLRVNLNGNTYVTQGAFPTLDQVGLVFYATNRNPLYEPGSSGTTASGAFINPNRNPNDFPNPSKWMNLIVTDTSNVPAAYVASGNTIPNCQTTEMRAVMMFHFSCVNSTASGASTFWIKVKGTPFSVSFKNTTASLNIPTQAGVAVQWNSMGVLTQNPNFNALFDKNWNVAKTFKNTNEGYSTSAHTWSLTSTPVTVPDPTDLNFGFTASYNDTVIEIYAPDPTNLDADPTGTPELLISSQRVDFSKWNNKTLPVPLAPRWNVRDGALRPQMTGTAYAWAGAELVPNINWSMAPTTENKELASGVPTNPLTYAFCGKTVSALSTDFSQRVLQLGGRRSGTASCLAESSTTADLRFSTLDDPAFEGVSLITPYDSAISMVVDPTQANLGDPRLVKTGNATFKRIDQVFQSGARPVLPFSSADHGGASTFGAQYHALGSPGAAPMFTGYRIGSPGLTGPTFVVGGASRAFATVGNLYNDNGGAVGQLGRTSGAYTVRDWVGADSNVTMSIDAGWDWTSMPGGYTDGGYLNRPDQDYQSLMVDYSDKTRVAVPYFQRWGITGSSNAGYFSPNRQVASPVMLGAIPSSLTTGWQTLCFCPNPAQGTSHPGLGTSNPPTAAQAPCSTAPDHLLLDYFWMPVAEPYPISEQFSTAGKVNLNYAMMPFSYMLSGGTPYLQRKTALDAVLKSVWISALPSSMAADYKSWYNMSNSHSGQHSRYPINVDETLKAFDDKFLKGDIFRSASQVCEMFLYPNNPDMTTDAVPPLMSPAGALATWDASNSGISTWWNQQRLTSDNGREEPYNAVYSRVTTKSNTFTIHWRVQALRKGMGNQAVWDDARDGVQAELRGATLVERYLDPNASNIPDYASLSNCFASPGTVKPMSAYYKWRVVAENYFQP